MVPVNIDFKNGHISRMMGIELTKTRSFDGQATSNSAQAGSPIETQHSFAAGQTHTFGSVR